MREPVGVEVDKPTATFTMLGSPDAAACEGDSCLVVPPGIADTSVDRTSDDEPGRRGVSR
ncbi:hypothetical protein [Frigoribacterium sp. CFBP 8751]|uniref:hypothetical protein n=1 Tax=Frigoribacterium sp. CFBP 8751 TaxID=2775277 RepID=UPI00177ADA08|nr:hypothetical protein [Frigoribacterium sp. CFBP 8751]MBD8539132.1 hypothetical protein [Frigoribacterium sp. CFBP 8751]